MILPDEFEALWSADDHQASPDQGHWFVFHRSKLLVAGPPRRPLLPQRHHIPPFQANTSAARFIGRLDGEPCWAFDLPDDVIADPSDTAALAAATGLGSYSWAPLRGLFNALPDQQLAVAARGLQMLEFDRTHRFCGVCATETEAHEGSRSRRCPACGEVVYPRVAPAMMVLIKRDTAAGRELLLARSPRFPAGMFSALAGFVEISESIESCVHREAFEEVGVRIDNLRYFSSQAWPFPNSLMIAFVADWVGGDIRPEAGEIEEAQWFTLDALPQLPHRLSIARSLIDAVIDEARQ